MNWQSRAIELWREGGHSWADIVQILSDEYPGESFDKDRVRRPIRALPEYGARLQTEINVVAPHRKTIMLNRDGSHEDECVITGTDKQMNNKDYLLKAHGFDPPEEWELLYAKNSVYNVQIKGGSTDTYYASKITVRPSREITEKDVLEHFIEKAEKYSPVQPRVIKQSGENMLLLNVCDLHLGQLSWGEESGENYDYKIASERFKDLTSDAIRKSPYREYEKILYVKGNDFFNSDNMQGTTTKGTQQTNDVRPQKMFDKGTDLWIWALDALRTAFPQTPIHTELVPGNHDRLTCYYAAKVLYAWFRNDPTVIIDTSPRLHKGIAYGTTALLFTHGESELKHMDWVYKEFRHLMGMTENTEIHAGHFHRIKVEEKNGAIIRSNPSPSANGQYSYSEGYDSIAQIVSRVYSKQKGLEYEIYSKV